MIDVQLPRLLSDNGSTERYIVPLTIALNLNITPLSTVSMQLAKDESLPARGYVEIYTPMGSAGIYRVRSPQDAYGEDITTAELEHAIVEVGDYLVLEKYDEMMPASEAMQKVFSHYRGNKWKLGNIAALGSDEIAFQADHDRILESMLAILEQKPDCMMSFDFSTVPWTVNIVKRGDSVTAEGRLSRNVNYAKVIYDDTEQCTRVYYEIPYVYEEAKDEEKEEGSEPPDTMWTYMDADTISKYGIIERQITTGLQYTKEESEKVAKEYLKKHKEPRISIEIGAEELSAITGEDYDTFTIGKLFRLSLYDYGVIIEKNITRIEWPDVYNSPEDFVVYLADEEDTAITFLHDLDAKGGSGGGGGALKEIEQTFKEYFTRFEQDDYHFDLVALHVDENMNILQQAGLYIDADGVLQYATDNENNLMSYIHTQAGRIDLVSQKVDEHGERISSAEISINGLLADILLKADKKDVDDRLNEAYIDINGAKATIEQHTGQLDEFSRKISSAEIKINGLEATIDLKVDKDGIISAINLAPGNIRISADKINLDGYVTSSEFAALKAEVGNMWSGSLEASAIQVMQLVVTNTARILGHTVKWLSTDVVTSVELNKTSNTGVTYSFKDYNNEWVSVRVPDSVANVSLKTETSSINFLGYE